MQFGYLATEVKRAARNPRYVLFTIAMPLVLFLVIGNAYTGDVAGVSAQTWYMINMAIFGATSAALGTGARISVERDAGWNRQLRLTPLPPIGYVMGKVVTALLLALVSILLVCGAGFLTGRVSLDIAQWLTTILVSWLCLIPLAVVGVGIGYLARGDSAQAVNAATLLLLSMFGGLWFPLDDAPTWLHDIAYALPTYWMSQLSRAPLTHHWPQAAAYLVLIGWAVAAARVAARRYRADALRPA